MPNSSAANAANTPTGKTIRQIADEIGVSKQAVQKRIVREPLVTQLSGLLITVSGVTYIPLLAENLIKSAFANSLSYRRADPKPPPPPIVESPPPPEVEPPPPPPPPPEPESRATNDKLHESFAESLTAFSVVIEALRAQLTARDRQLEEAREDNRRLLALLEHEQQLRAGTLRAQLTDGSKRGIFSRVFGRRGG